MNSLKENTLNSLKYIGKGLVFVICSGVLMGIFFRAAQIDKGNDKKRNQSIYNNGWNDAYEKAYKDAVIDVYFQVSYYLVDDKQDGDATLWRKDSSIKIHQGVGEKVEKPIDNNAQSDKVTP